MEHFPSTLTPQESDALIARINHHFAHHGYGPYAAELKETGAFIGYIGLYTPTFEAHFTPAIEIAWRLAADHWGRGLATEGARAVLHHAFHTLNLASLVSFTVPANQRSSRVMEKLGMICRRRTLLDGIDSVIYGIDRGEFEQRGWTFAGR